MVLQLFTIFLNVVVPVFALVALGYVAGPPLKFEVRTLSRIGYYLFVPAFSFNIISQADLQAQQTIQQIGYIVVVHTACAALGFLVAKLLGRSRQVAAAYGLLAVFGNVGNFGLSMVEFRLGSEAVVAGTVYFLTVSTTAFIIGVALASWAQNGKATALFAVFKTPALLALWPALFFIVTPLEVPLFLTRITGLLANAMIPVMLVTLGTQLAAAGKLRFERDVLIASLIRLLGGPILAVLLADFFNLNDLTRYASILQASMPSAVLASIIAMEHDLLPDFVTKTVLISTVLSLFTLTFVLTFVIP